MSDVFSRPTYGPRNALELVGFWAANTGNAGEHSGGDLTDLAYQIDTYCAIRDKAVALLALDAALKELEVYPSKFSLAYQQIHALRAQVEERGVEALKPKAVRP